MSERPADPSRAPRGRADRVLGILLPVFSAGLAIVGAILLATPAPPASFGWFAYVPLSTTTFAPTPWFSTLPRAVGAALLLAGAGSLLFCLGWAVGRRSHPRALRSGRP